MSERRIGPAVTRRALAWGLSLAALAFVVWIIPVRDRCWDPGAPASTRVAVSRTADGCTLHVPSGDVGIDRRACSQLRCEPGVLSTFADARLPVVAAMFALYAFGTLAWAARWNALLSLAGMRLSVGRVWRISIEAQAGGVLLPGGIGGDALRVTSVLAGFRKGEGAPRPWALVVASVLLDRAVGLAVLAGLAAALGLAYRSPSPGVDLLVATLLAIPAAFVLGLAVLRLHFFAAVDPGEGAGSRAGARPSVRALAPVLAYLRAPHAPRAIATAALLSVVVAAIQFATIRGLVFALGAVPAEEKWVYVGTAMAFIVGAIPALPGAWGTADATYVFFFGLAGIAAGPALAVCLLYRLFWYLCAVVGAVLHASGAQSPAATLEADSADTI
ncbi:MAG TPA: lysylphosphatidylglycerol synthase transmembrane domain-containing protein, partial [Polyangiaceae bacterium]|nr:lysylphosphatidylglycerol synthase transmembrane domain-containing protein [Polyangiaceae bacterium]